MTTCYQNCATGETNIDTYTCRKPQLDNGQFNCAVGCGVVSCGSSNGRSYRCVNDGYRFPIFRCHCRSDAANYAKATKPRNWQCPAGTFLNQGTCQPCVPGSYQSKENQNSCIDCPRGILDINGLKV
jgi:hypothetical protein